MDTSYDHHLQVFFGQASHAEAYIYVELSGMDSEGWEITGSIRGPHTRFAHTLPAKIPLRQSASGSTVLVEAIVPDPCFWLPEAPYQYTASIELRKNGEPVFNTEREFGIRPLATSGRNLMMLGKRWVLRSAWVSQPSVQHIADCRDSNASFLCDSADREICRQASEQGVLVVAHVAVGHNQLAAELGRLGRWPAVGMVVLAETVTEIDRSTPKNLLLGQLFDAGREIQPATWADAVLVECCDPNIFAKSVAECPLPVIAYRRDASTSSVQEARSACDALQRDLAPHGDFAGYVIAL